MPCCAARPGTIEVLAAASGMASDWPVSMTCAVPDGPSPKRRKASVESDAPARSWANVEQSHEVGGEQVLQRRLEGAADLLGVGRASGLTGETLKRAHFTKLIDQTGTPLRDSTQA